jgi:hypothetical protein
MTFNWTAFEDALDEELERALRRLGRSYRSEVFYAVALYQVYREEDGLLSLPMLGANVVDGSPPTGGSFWDERFNPHGWAHAEVPLRHKQALALERKLTAEACRSTRKHWRRTEARHSRLLVRLARRLRDVSPKLISVSGDFVCFVHDEEGGPALARKTIPKARFESLFPKTVGGKRERRALAKQVPEERAAFLVTRFGCYGEGVNSEVAANELVALGPAAIPALLGALKDEDDGWLAAKILGDIGHATPQVLRALRKRVKDGFWPAMALGMLGDERWLMKQPAEDAIGGLAAPLKAIATRSRRPTLAYAPLETYLQRIGKSAIACAEKELAPGSSYREIDGRDTDEALRGLTSPFAVIRWHASSLLGDRSLGKAAGKRILPALGERLGDDNATVRRLALLAIVDWKAAAKPYRAAIEALATDRNASVRNIVAHVLKHG